ncbi:hypothetical protein HUK29_0162 [Listeria phage LP-Mix_6.1]|uniref:Uncharacterized protein n=1 Tax=Listeria phage LP-Mix_6.1 TaxID=2759380 RepID=A0A7G9A5A6_9CAUD|nr:hypothetical protein HUK29_0162 [Listeria phage LP-Mix_6.1]
MIKVEHIRYKPVDFGLSSTPRTSEHYVFKSKRGQKVVTMKIVGNGIRAMPFAKLKKHHLDKVTVLKTFYVPNRKQLAKQLGLSYYNSEKAVQKTVKHVDSYSDLIAFSKAIQALPDYSAWRFKLVGEEKTPKTKLNTDGSTNYLIRTSAKLLGEDVNQINLLNVSGVLNKAEAEAEKFLRVLNLYKEATKDD